jgi:hypothetical protein
MLEVSGLDTRLGSVEARVGYRLLAWLSLEAEGAFGVRDHRETVGGWNRVQIAQDHSAGAFAVVRVPVSERATLLARLGYRDARFTLTVSSPVDPPYRWSASEGGVVFGVGAEYAFKDYGLRADYASAIDATPWPNVKHADTLSISIVKHF